MKRASKRLHDVILQASKHYDTERQFSNFLKYRDRAAKRFHIAEVEESSGPWLRFKEDLMKRLPVRSKLDFSQAGLPSTWDALYTQMGEIPRSQVVVSHGGTPDIEKRISTRSDSLIQETMLELFPDSPFFGVGISKEASTGLPTMRRDTAYRGFLIHEFFKLPFEELKKWCDLKLSDAHWKLLESDYFWAQSKCIERRQPSNPKKKRKEWTLKGDFEEIDDVSELGGNWRTCRRRRPLGADGRANLGMACLFNGMQVAAKHRFPNLLDHRSPEHTAQKMERWIAARKQDYEKGLGYPGSLKKRGIPFKPILSSFDVSGMEKQVSVNCLYHLTNHMDQLIPTYGITRLIHQAAIVFGYGGKLYTSNEGPYDGLTPLGYGTPSGWFTVATNNQLAIMAAMRELMEDVYGWKMRVTDFDAGDRVLQLSKTDDNMFVFLCEADAKRLVGKEFTVQNLPISFEGEYDDNLSYGEFLAYEYWLDRDSGSIRVAKKLGSQIFNKIISEYGLLDLEGQWLRPSKTGLKSPGKGYILSALDYAYHENYLIVDEILRDLFQKHFKMQWFDAWPTTISELRDVDAAVDPESIMTLLLDEDPDKAHRWGDLADLPIEILEKFYLYISPSDMKEYVGDNIEYAEHPPGEAMPKRDETISRSWIQEREAELSKAGML
jgi:hypothetical protein